MQVEQLQIQLAAFETFMASAAYGSYLHTKRVDLQMAEQQILAIRPTMETLPALNELHGKREQLIEDLEIFEVSCANLKAAISAAADDASTTAHNEETTI